MSKKKKEVKTEEQVQEFWTIPEIEGDKYGWFYICGNCHSQIIWHQEKCTVCKRRLDWHG